MALLRPRPMSAMRPLSRAKPTSATVADSSRSIDRAASRQWVRQRHRLVVAPIAQFNFGGSSSLRSIRDTAMALQYGADSSPRTARFGRGRKAGFVGGLPLTMTRCAWYRRMTCQGCRPRTQTSLDERGLINVRFASHCGLKADISPRPRNAKKRHMYRSTQPLIRSPRRRGRAASAAQ
jgi:uncharacterized protein (DUF1684 family)